MKFLAPLVALVFIASESISAPQGGDATCVVQQAKLTATNVDGALGTSVAAEGDTAVFGAYGDASQRGSAFVFERQANQWSQQVKLLAPGGVAGDHFGTSVAISGDTLVVGAPKVDFVVEDRGMAYVFVKSGSSWVFQKRLEPSARFGYRSQFGQSVAIQGNTIAVGSPGLEATGKKGGAVFVYVRSGTVWTEQAWLFASDGKEAEAFGCAVDIDGESLAIGCLGDGEFGFGAGAGYVFQRNGTTWTEQQKLLAADTNEGDLLGWDIAISGSTVLIGALGKELGAMQRGAAYVFQQVGGQWIETQKLLAADMSSVGGMGSALAIEGDVALISAVADYSLAPNGGAVFVFSRGGAGQPWDERFKLFSDTPQQSGYFGYALDTGHNTAVVGVPYEDVLFPDSGAVHVLGMNTAIPLTYCTAKPNSCATLPAIEARGLPSASAAAGFNVYASNTRAGKAGLLLYTDAGRGNAPFAGGILCLATTPLKRTVPVLDTTGTNSQCDGRLVIDMNAFAAGTLGGNPLASLRVPGTTVTCQFWARDTATSALLSNALEYVVCD